MNLTVEEVTKKSINSQADEYTHSFQVTKMTSLREFGQFVAKEPAEFLVAGLSIIIMLAMAAYIMKIKLHITTNIPLVLMFLFIGMGFRTVHETLPLHELPTQMVLWSTGTEVNNITMPHNVTSRHPHTPPQVKSNNRTIRKLPITTTASQESSHNTHNRHYKHPLYIHVMVITKPFIRISLSAVGLQIGSHLNRETLQPILFPIIKFIIIFTAIVMITMNFVSAVMFPSLTKYGRLIGAIALERSSPEALAGIVSSNSCGTFTSVVMCIAAVLDVLSLVCYVCASATIASSSSEAILYLAEIAFGTVVAAFAAIFVANLTKEEFFMKRIKDLIRILSIKKDKEVVTSSILTSPKVELSDGASDLSSVTSVIPSSNLSHLEHRPLFISKSKRFGTKEQQDLGTTLTVIILVFVIPIVGWFIEVELLIAAVSAGIALNYNERHPVMDMIEGYDYITNIVLFTFMGHRIILLSYMSSMWLALIFFTVRIFSLWIGSFVGGKLAHLPSRAPDHQWHHQYRWMALITQLAIALSLVDRMEEEFPESAPIARAYGGAVLLAIVIGPPALQTVLRIVGEDNGHKQKVQQVTRMSPTN